MMETISRRMTANRGGLLVAPILLLLAGTASAASASPEKEPPVNLTILVLGDSLAAGYGLEPSEAFPALLEQKIRTLGRSDSVINAGQSGDTSAGGLRRIDWLLKRRIDVLIIELGGNDGLRGLPPEATKTNLQGIIERARKKYPNIKILLAGMQMPNNMGPEYVARYEKVFEEVAAEASVHLIPGFLQGVGGIVELNQPDLIHPTAEGHKILAENVWKVLKPVVESQRVSAH